MKMSIFVGLFFVLPMSAQPQIDSTITALQVMGRQILEHPEATVRDSLNQRFKSELRAFLGQEGVFQRDLSRINNMMQLVGPKERFAVFTWQCPDADYKYTRHGLIAVETRSEIKVIPLTDAMDELGDWTSVYGKPERWPGAIYYQMVPFPDDKEKFLLLGFAPGEPLNQKIIEVLEIDKRGRVRFGAKVFRVEKWMDRILKKAPLRLILKYNAKYSTSVRWNEKNEMVIMDHLAPPDVKMKGLYIMYGPDFTYDGLYYEDDWWHLSEGVQFNTQQEVIIKPPSEPIDLPK